VTSVQKTRQIIEEKIVEAFKDEGGSMWQCMKKKIHLRNKNRRMAGKYQKIDERKRHYSRIRRKVKQGQIIKIKTKYEII